MGEGGGGGKGEGGGGGLGDGGGGGGGRGLGDRRPKRLVRRSEHGSEARRISSSVRPRGHTTTSDERPENIFEGRRTESWLNAHEVQSWTGEWITA